MQVENNKKQLSPAAKKSQQSRLPMTAFILCGVGVLAIQQLGFSLFHASNCFEYGMISNKCKCFLEGGEAQGSFHKNTTGTTAAAPMLPAPSSTTGTSNNKDNKSNSNNTKMLYYCGEFPAFEYYQNLANLIFPDYTWHRVNESYIATLYYKREKFIHRPLLPSTPTDIFLKQWEEHCHLEIHVWLHQTFRGKVIWFHPESVTQNRPIPRPSFIELGAFVGLGTHDNHVLLTFFQTVFYSLSKQQQAIIIGHKNNNNIDIADGTPPPPPPQQQEQRPYFLIYANSNCVRYRETAFREFAALGETLHGNQKENSTGWTPASFGGRCKGSYVQSPHIVLPRRARARNIVSFENSVVLDTFQDNIEQVYTKFRFCLVMEHEVVSGYITEKLLLALVAQCIPIYHGPMEEVYDMIDSKFIIHYDPNNPQEALEKVRFLEENKTAYQQHTNMVRDAISQYGMLPDGETTRRKYFSFTDSIGDGYLKQKVRSRVGLPE